jgi:hypothetical protein
MSTSTSPIARWPERVLTFGSLRQAARKPIADAFRMRAWDLVVVDLSGGQEKDVEALRRLVEEAPIGRVLALDDSCPCRAGGRGSTPCLSPSRFLIWQTL